MGRAKAEVGIHDPMGCLRLAPLPLGIDAVARMDRIHPVVAYPLSQGLAGVGAPARTIGANDTLGAGLPHRLRPNQEAPFGFPFVRGTWRTHSERERPQKLARIEKSVAGDDTIRPRLRRLT